METAMYRLMQQASNLGITGFKAQYEWALDRLQEYQDKYVTG